MTNDQQLLKAAEDAFGGETETAARLGVSVSSLTFWRRGSEHKNGRAIPGYMREALLAHLTLHDNGIAAYSRTAQGRKRGGRKARSKAPTQEAAA